MKKRQITERSRYIIIISLFLIIVNVTLGLFLIQLSQKALITQIEGRMLDITNTAADMLNGDKLKNLKKEDYNTKDYQDAIKILERFMNNIDLEYIYCIKQVNDKEFVFSVDPTKKDPGEFGSPIVYTDALYTASQGKAAVDTSPYNDSWGRFYSAYSPVFDSNGDVALIVAVDFSADWYDNQVNMLERTVLIICLLSLLGGGSIVILITQRTRRRNKRLYAELNSLAENVEELVSEVSNTVHTEYQRHLYTDSYSSGDDIRDLSNKIETMQDELRTKIACVHRMAYIDALTAINNTTAYIETINNLNNQISNGYAKFSVVAFDVNGLKQINDKHGHDGGDRALVDTADIISKVFGKENVYRVGGDEFIAVISTDSSKKLDKLFEQFDKTLEEENKNRKSSCFPILISKGYSIYQKGKDSEYKDVSRRADAAMYEDKNAFYKRNRDMKRR